MAEISYPFSADNATTGAAKVVSETQWQSMAHMWGGDRVDYLLTNETVSSSTLPFNPRVMSVTSVQIAAGRAWVGGFYYELTAAMNVAISANTANTGRVDLIVVRLDMSKPAVNLAVRKGTNAATPVPPQPARQAGGIWELPLAHVTVPANGGTITVANRAPMNFPPSVAFPWNAYEGTALTPAGTFGYDMDNNTNGVQAEYFNGRDGLVVTRNLSASEAYTPSLINNASSPAAAKRIGKWRWIAPGAYWFSINIDNDAVRNSTGTGALGVTLPSVAGKGNIQILNGIIINPNESGGSPNMMAVTGRVIAGTSNMFLYTQNWKTLGEGLDSLLSFPANSRLEISGVIESNSFNA